MVYTLPRAIKEEKKNEERVGGLESKKREQGWQIVKREGEKQVRQLEGKNQKMRTKRVRSPVGNFG